MVISLCIVALSFLVPWQGVTGTMRSLDIHRGQAPEQLRRALEKTNFDLWSLYLPTEVESNSTCGYALEEMQDALSGDSITGAHKLFDSWGKQGGAGSLISFPYYLGVYDECKHSVFGNDTFRGRYCKIHLRTEIIEKSHKIHPKFLQMLAPAEVQGAIVDILNSNQTNGTEISYSTCIPDACTRGDLETSLMEVLKNSDLVIEGIDCHMDFTSDDFSAGDIAFITVLSGFAFMLLLASVVDIYIQKTRNKALANGGFQYLLPFSAYSNIDKLFHMNTESPPGTITCLHGIRVLSMTWVVYAHQQTVTFVYTSNLLPMFSKMNGIIFQTILSGFPSVDTFFFIGGFLMSYSVLREFQRSGRFNIVMFYFHRRLRLIPPIALVSGLYATIVKYFMDGPLGPYWNYWRDMCQEGWWKDVNFIDNFVFRAGGQSCLGQCWYLAVDTQIYIFAPLVLLPLMYKREIGLVWLYFLTVASAIIPSAITYAHDLPPTTLLLDPKGGDAMNLVYIMPWCRAAPVLIGIWLGVFIQKQGKSRIKLKPWQVLSGWTVAAVTGLMVVFGLWSYNVFPRKTDYDVMTQVLYSGLHRPAWAAAVSWVVFACYNGYGGFVDDFLSHPIWQPISRLTYSMYLVAMPLQYAIAYNTRSQFYFSHYNKILETVGALIISIIPAILVSITVESPVIGVEKLIFRRPGREENAPMQSKKLNGVDNEAFEEIKQLDRNDKIENGKPREETAL